MSERVASLDEIYWELKTIRATLDVAIDAGEKASTEALFIALQGLSGSLREAEQKLQEIIENE